jgi:hypothetical protein
MEVFGKSSQLGIGEKTEFSLPVTMIPSNSRRTCHKPGSRGKSTIVAVYYTFDATPPWMHRVVSIDLMCRGVLNCGLKTMRLVS